MALVFAAAIFLSAFLLFLVQPLMGKMILPMLGGTPAVWNTCMLFYQTVLLAGYGYVHLLNRKVAPRLQLPIHLVVLAVPLLLLPIELPKGWVPPDHGNPMGWVLLLLIVAIGPPFFVLSTTAPLLQRWFSWTDHPSAGDPYFLYAASNAGSMLGLLGYPFLIEPWLPLKGGQGATQVSLWSLGYGGLLLLIAACALLVRRTWVERPALAESTSPPPTVAMLARWTALAAIPSSLLLGTTTYITTNVAAIPLLWVVPLALYLLSFIIVFAQWPLTYHRLMVLALPPVLLAMAFSAMPIVPALPYWLGLPLPLLGLTVVALVCHGELARTRPPTDRLTVFYLVMSVGGALGGLFNALLAPIIFNDIYEYEIALVLACLMVPGLQPLGSSTHRMWSPYRWMGNTAPTLEGIWIVLLIAVTGISLWIVKPQRDDPDVSLYLLAALPVSLCYLGVGRPARLGLGLAAVFITAHVFGAWWGDPVLYQTRTFFGVLKVEHTKAVNTHTLVHGTIKHGVQRMDPDHQRDSISYFHPTAPYGQVFAAFSGPLKKQRIAVTGLGVAALANYCDAGQALTYYEIDPAVVTIAETPRLFTYIEDTKARGVDFHVVVGDARLKMEEAQPNGYDMIILDAFTSDAIPVHLLTKEAMDLYLRKLTLDGLLVVHISNRYLGLEPVLGNLADELGLMALKQFDFADGIPFKYGSDLVVMARQKEALGPLASDARWSPLERSPSVGVWSDDYSNVVKVFR